MRNLLLGAYSFLCILGILLIFVIIPKQTPEYLGYGLPSSFLPNLLAVCIAIFSFLELIKTYKNKEDKRPSSINKSNLIHLAKFSAVGFLAFPLMDIITFIPGAILVLCAFQYLCGQRSIKTILALAFGLSISIYLISTYLLNIPLP